MISSTQARGIPDTVASSVLAALRAGITTITFASPLPGGGVGQRLMDLEHWTRQRILPPLMATTAPPEIFKAYDVRGLYGEQIDGDVAEAVGRAFARVLADLAGKPAGELRVGLGRDMRLTAPELAARYRDGADRPRARTCSTPGWSARRCSITSSARATSTAG